MATLKRIQTPIRNPLTLENIRAQQTRQYLTHYSGSNITIDSGQLAATISDPFGFKATIDGLQNDISSGIPGFLVGGAVLIVGIMLLWAGLNAFILPSAGKAIGAVAKAVA